MKLIYTLKRLHAICVHHTVTERLWFITDLYHIDQSDYLISLAAAYLN